jgi:glycosyltransferase involved in cell wall biosynthesis
MDLAPWRHSITFFTKRKAREQHNLQVFERVLEQFDPDIIFIWGMWNLPNSLPAYAEACYPDQVVYRFATYWPTLPSQHEFYWRSPGRNWYSRLMKRLLGQVALGMLAKEAQQPRFAFRHAICVSAASRKVLVEAGVPISHARVIHTGLNDKLYLNGGEQHSVRLKDSNLKLLYAGRLKPEKGIETVIEAMTRLVFGQGKREISLSVAGSGSVDYENHLQRSVDQAGLTGYVSFMGWAPPEEMPELLRKFDVVVVPSIWPEPFARAVLEGMISGLVVLASRIGGTPEIVLDGENGLLFTPNDPDDLAKKIAHLTEHPELRKKLAFAGQQTVLERFTMTKMMDQIEGYLQEVASASTTEKIGNLETIQFSA